MGVRRSPCAYGEPLWIEGSGGQIVIATQQPIPSSSQAPQQVVIPEAAEEDTQDVDGFDPISKSLDARQRLFLQTTPEEVQRGAVTVIACRLCPGMRGSWVTYKRHCKSVDKHPVLTDSHFCPVCGDYFGHKDSGDRPLLGFMVQHFKN